MRRLPGLDELPAQSQPLRFHSPRQLHMEEKNCLAEPSKWDSWEIKKIKNKNGSWCKPHDDDDTDHKNYHQTVWELGNNLVYTEYFILTRILRDIDYFHF